MDQDKNNSIKIHEFSRLKWACRRGMLELDVLLGNFLEHGYHELPDEEKLLFIRLLGCADPEVFSWLMGKELPEDKGLARVVEIIRRHAKSRF